MTSRCAVFGVALLLCLRVGVAAQLTPVDAGGLRAALDDLRGHVVLVNFWATWCRPCLEEIPIFMELEKTLHEQGFRLVAVSLDDAATNETLVQPFMEKWFPEFNSYQSAEYSMDQIVSVVDPVWNEILPTSYLLASDGTVAERIQGSRTATEFKTMIAAQLQKSNQPLTNLTLQ